MALLDKYSTPLSAKAAEHLLRRTMFGATRTDIATLTGKTIDQALDLLLRDQTAPPPPTIPGTTTTWVNDATRSPTDGQNLSYMKAWWMSLMLNQPLSIMEKMTLFWHNHFPSQFSVIQDTRFLYKQHQLLRQHALGNFRTLVKDITLDPAMLIYLNGFQNRRGSPQENYARELQELFTIGKGPEISQGNYTTYTEDDVKAAAKVLTGWGFPNNNRNSLTIEFNSNNHEPGNKQFSAAYQNTIIKGIEERTGTAQAKGLAEIDDMLAMIFRQNATSEYIVSKLYRFFVNSNITATITNEFIKPLAKIFRDNNFEIKPVLRALFSSTHFFDENTLGCMIKTPLDLMIGTMRALQIQPFAYNQTAVAQFNDFWNNKMIGLARTSQQDILELPNVAGWQAYYQEPLFYQSWINTATMPARADFSTSIVSGWRLRDNLAPYYAPFDSVTFLQQLPNVDPKFPDQVVKAYAEHFYAIDLTDEQIDYLVETILMSKAPRYVWGEEWSAFMLDITKKNDIKTRLDKLLVYMMKIAEYQIM